MQVVNAGGGRTVAAPMLTAKAAALAQVPPTPATPHQDAAAQTAHGTVRAIADGAIFLRTHLFPLGSSARSRADCRQTRLFARGHPDYYL